MSDNDFEPTSSSKSPTTSKNPSYSNTGIDIRNINQYKLVTEAYEGSAGFCDGSYLLPHQREAFFRDRQILSYYRNYMRPIVESIAIPAVQGVRRTTDSELYDAFLANVDNKGNTITNHLIEVLINSRLHGNVFVVMDNFINQPLTLEDALATRNIPYVYTQPAYTVYDHKADSFGNLISISFFSDVKDEKGQWVKIVTTWDDTTVKVEVIKNKKVLSSSSREHGYGIMPVLQVNSTIDKSILPFPPFYDITRLEYALYNKDSEIRDQERAQAFSVFYVQTDIPQNGIVLGPHNAIIIPANEKITMPPGFISPDSSILTTLVANSKELVEAIYRAAQEQGTVAVQKQTSGVAEGYKFVGTANQLKKSAEIAYDYELRLHDMFDAITNSTSDIEINYKKDFYPAINSQNIDNTIKLLSMELSDEIKQEIKSVLVRDILGHLDIERLDELTNAL